MTRMIPANFRHNTMQRAMAELEREGYVVTNRTTGRTVTDNVGVIMESKKSTAIELTHKYIEKMEQLGFSKEQIVKIIEEGK